MGFHNPVSGTNEAFSLITADALYLSKRLLRNANEAKAMKNHADGEKSQTTDKSATPLWQSALVENCMVQGLKSPSWMHLAGS